MFCFLSHIIEDCYFDEIEIFFLVVGHTHNILDQWFGVLARAIRKANFIGSVLALHAIYKIAHAEKVEHLRPKVVHQIEVYHDFRKYYGPLLNNDIHHFGIPLRWKLKRDELLAVSTSQYQVVSPTAGLSHLETWQPLASKLANIESIGSVDLSLFMSYGGPEVLYNTLGINTSKHASSVDLLTDIAKTRSKKSTAVGDVADVLPLIRDIEVRAILETEKRLEAESEGLSTEKVALSKDEINLIDKEITAGNSSKGGRIVWLRRSKISDDPNYLGRRPDLLPNPKLWFGIIKTDAEKRKILEENAKNAGVSQQPKIKTDPEATLAQSRLIAFQRGAADIATTASQVLKMIPSQIDLDEETQDIKKATSNFRKPVLTKREQDWYTSLSTSNKILQRQEALIQAELSKPWEILRIPVETPEQKRWREKMMAERVAITAQVEARLRKILLRAGEGEYNPNLQIVTMDGFNAASVGDIDSMRRPQMEQLAKGHIPEFRKLKVDKLREALKAFMASNPGVIQLPGDAPINDNTGAAAPSNNAAITIDDEPINSMEEDEDNLGEKPITLMQEENMTTSRLCAVMECTELGGVWCDQCQLHFCDDLHARHYSHSRQKLKDGMISKSDWNQTSTEEVVPECVNLESAKKRKERPDTAEEQPQLLPLPVQQVTILKNIFRMEWDDQEKRSKYENGKLSEAAEFIKSIQDGNLQKYEILYSHFNYENYYDVNFLCTLADYMCIDISQVTCKRRFNRKELLDYVIKQII